MWEAYPINRNKKGSLMVFESNITELWVLSTFPHIKLVLKRSLSSIFNMSKLHILWDFWAKRGETTRGIRGIRIRNPVLVQNLLRGTMLAVNVAVGHVLGASFVVVEIIMAKSSEIAIRGKW